MTAMRYLDLALDRANGPIELQSRTVVPYDDHDGISMLCDREALLTLYRDHSLHDKDPFDPGHPSVARDPTRTLTSLANAGHAVSWGTHQPPGECVAVLSIGPFDADELAVNGMCDRLDVGFVDVRGSVFVAGWHAFTYGADYLHGALAAPRLDIPPGYYRVTVFRPFAADEATGANERGLFLLQLEASPRDAVSAFTTVPGADDWF